MSQAIDNLIDLSEDFRSPAGQALKVDREKGIIFGVKVLGEVGNDVYPKATREKVIPLIEGARVNVDHAPRSQANETRSYRDAFGVHKNVREEGNGLYADHHFSPKHPLAEQLFWDAENAPNNLGYSIASRGRSTKTDSEGRRIIEEICFDRRTHSVDLVTSPATTRGLAESRKPTMKKKILPILEAHFKASPKALAVLKEMAEAGLMGPDTEMEAPDASDAAGSGGDDADAALAAGFRAAVLKVLDDKSLDIKGKVKKIKDILTMEEKMLAKDAADDSAAADAVTPATESQAKPAHQAGTVELLERRLRFRDLCTDAAITPSKTLRKALDACTTDAEAKELIEEAKTAAAATQAAATTPVTESSRPAGQAPRSATPGQPPAGAAGSGTAAIQESKPFTDDERKARREQLRSIR